jgi:DDRGK domain-containing protein 1
LEELAVMFKMRTQEVVDKLTAWDKEGKLTGVIDDRGKFVHITAEEMDKIAKFITRRGRVSIGDITKEWYAATCAIVGNVRV